MANTSLIEAAKITPSTARIPPPNRARPHVFTSPVPKPPTMAGASRPPPKLTPKRPPAGPPLPPLGRPSPVGPQPVVGVEIHFRLRFLTVLVLTSFSAL